MRLDLVELELLWLHFVDTIVKFPEGRDELGAQPIRTRIYRDVREFFDIVVLCRRDRIAPINVADDDIEGLELALLVFFELVVVIPIESEKLRHIAPHIHQALIVLFESSNSGTKLFKLPLKIGLSLDLGHFDFSNEKKVPLDGGTKNQRFPCKGVFRRSFRDPQKISTAKNRDFLSAGVGKSQIEKCPAESWISRSSYI